MFFLAEVDEVFCSFEGSNMERVPLDKVAYAKNQPGKKEKSIGK